MFFLITNHLATESATKKQDTNKGEVRTTLERCEPRSLTNQTNHLATESAKKQQDTNKGECEPRSLTNQTNPLATESAKSNRIPKPKRRFKNQPKTRQIPANNSV